MELRIRLTELDTRRTGGMLRWLDMALILTGIALLGYCAAELIETQQYQINQEIRFDQAIASIPPATIAATAEKTLSEPSAAKPGPDVRANAATRPADAVIGRLEINAIGLRVMIAEGVDDATLQHAVGHVPGTPLPGELGNVAIAGHRDSFFRGLRNIHQGDEITVTTLRGTKHYVVDLIELVSPDDTTALDNTSDDRLTLVTCFPFYFVGPAPKRFIVSAHLAE